MPKPKKLIELPPKKCWVNFTREEADKWKSHIKHLLWKDESPTSGPVWVVFNEVAKEEGFWESNVSRNYEDSGKKSSGGYFAKWLTYSKARDIAEQMGIEFETC